MLQVEWSPAGLTCSQPNHSTFTSAARMPVDFASYLLSSSPPGFEFYALRSQYSVGNDGKTQERNGFGTVKPIIQNVQAKWEEETSNPLERATSDHNEVNTNQNNQSEEKTEETVQRTVSKSKMGKKKVSFADELGFCLTSVRIMTESSGTPPRLRPEILSTLAQGASAGVTETPPLVLTFKQPASDYLGFREKLERENVALENVILKDYNLLGTIKVKNVSYEKSVFVRCTFNSWESNTDITAQHVPCPSAGGSPFDTFSFQMSVPPNFDINKKIQFCICYETSDGKQYWDNNNGDNYGVVSADWKSENKSKDESGRDAKTVFSLGPGNDWADYSSWSLSDSSVPYW